MFIVRAIGQIVSLPLLWAGLLAGYLGGPSAALLAIAWRLNGGGSVARQALVALHRERGAEPALLRAREWLGRRPSADIAAFAGLTALELDDSATAAALLAQGQRLGPDREGLLELLEWLLTARTQGGTAMSSLAARFEARRDLSPLVSRLVRSTVLWEAMMRRAFEEARRRAEHLLAVEEVPQARLALWALARRDGRTAQAEAHLQRARLEASQKLYFQILGSVAIGEFEEARRLLAWLEALDPQVAAVAARAVQSPQEAAR